MIYRPHMTSTELRALLSDPYSPSWDFDEAVTELIRRASAASMGRSVDDEDADVEGDRYENDIYRRGETRR